MSRVVVVGGGTAGAVVASRLSERDDLLVLLLEEGPDDLSYDQSVIDPGRAHELWNGAPLAAPFTMRSPWGDVPMLRGRVLGGTSATNYLATVRGQPADYDRWEASGLPGWSWVDVQRTFCDLEADLDFGPSPLHGDAGPLPVRRWRPDQFARCHVAFVGGLLELGVHRVDDVNDPSQLPGVGVFPATVDPTTGERVTTSQAFLADAVRKRSNLEIRTTTRVDSVVVDGGTAVGVRLVDGEVIPADEAVVCAGAVESPAILLRSGVGLAVGQHLEDHVGPVALFHHPGPAGGSGGPAQTLYIGADDDGTIDLHIFPAIVRSDDDGTTFAMLTYLLRSTDGGSVTLAPEDPAGPPVVQLPPLPPGGTERIGAALDLIAAWEETPAARALGSTRLTPPGDLTSMMSYGHMVGSCAMGTVLDEHCRVRGVAGLRVVDASSMPTIPAGNTYLGCVMLAERVCQRWDQ